MSRQIRRWGTTICAALMFYAAQTLAGSLATADAALDMVQELRLGLSLHAVCTRVAVESGTFRDLVGRVGPARARAALWEGVSTQIAADQSRWESALAQGYAQVLTQDEMQSLAMRRDRSPYFARFLELEPRVSMEVQRNSSELLNRLVSGALASAVKIAIQPAGGGEAVTPADSPERSRDP